LDRQADLEKARIDAEVRLTIAQMSRIQSIQQAEAKAEAMDDPVAQD